MCANFVFTSLLIAVCVFDLSQAQWVIDDDGCRTPDGGFGECKSIYSCKPMLDFLNAAKRPLTQADRNLLFSYHCGYEKNVAKVCCPDKPIRPQQGGGSVDNIVDPIQQHRNIKLIPVENCGLIQIDNKILNGNITALFEFPWMALLRYNEGGKDAGFQCGGTLINERYILTAAHCLTAFKQQNKVLTLVRMGEYDLKLDQDCESHFGGDTVCADPVQDFGIEETIPHPQFNVKTIENDIGLVRLSRKANLSVDNVKPVCLPMDRSVRNPVLQNATVTGWGRTENAWQSNVLLKVELPIMAPEECNRRYTNIAKISDNQICAGGINQKDSCGGDSGGPMQKAMSYQSDLRYIQYGVVSFGPSPCSTRGLPGVYTKVSKYLGWILDNIKA